MIIALLMIVQAAGPVTLEEPTDAQLARPEIWTEVPRRLASRFQCAERGGRAACEALERFARGGVPDRTPADGVRRVSLMECVDLEGKATRSTLGAFQLRFAPRDRSGVGFHRKIYFPDEVRVNFITPDDETQKRQIEEAVAALQKRQAPKENPAYGYAETLDLEDRSWDYPVRVDGRPGVSASCGSGAFLMRQTELDWIVLAWLRQAHEVCVISAPRSPGEGS